MVSDEGMCSIGGREVIAHLGDKDFNVIPIKIPGSDSVDPDQLIWMFIGKGKRHRITNIILKGKDKVRGLALSNIKPCHKATGIKRMW